jgi:hypothetical protein
LVVANYLREIPTDPITQKKDWQPLFTDTVLSPDQTATGIGDVHSAAGQIGATALRITTGNSSECVLVKMMLAHVQWNGSGEFRAARY